VQIQLPIGNIGKNRGKFRAAGEVPEAFYPQGPKSYFVFRTILPGKIGLNLQELTPSSVE
jgi:hypothetical protein